MKCPTKNNSDYNMEAHQDLIDSLYSHADQELSFKKPPTLVFQSDPRNYGVLSKTAQYDPSSQEITIYVDGRHMKDILRSFAHELVHHHQNEQGRLSGANVTQGEQDFDDIEGEAYHTGNLKLFRKWEDGIKQKNPTIYNERRIYKMSTKRWKNKELSNLMTEKFGFKMDLKKLNENVQEETLEEAKGSLVKHPHSDKVEIRKDPEGHNEWTVKKKGASGTGYHTDDLADAKLTAKKMAGEEVNEGRQPVHMAQYKKMSPEEKAKIDPKDVVGYIGPDGKDAYGNKGPNEELDEATEKLDEKAACSEGEMEEGHCMEETVDEGKGKCACGGPLDDNGKCKGCKSSPEDCKCEKKEAMNEEEDDDKEVGMNSVKNGYDKNPKVTKADFIPKKKDENLKEWKNKELSNNLNEKFGFKMDLNKLLK